MAPTPESLTVVSSIYLCFFFSREFNQQNFANIFILSLKNSQRHISFPLATCPSLLVKKIRMVALG